jgi:hypothetical protein
MSHRHQADEDDKLWLCLNSRIEVVYVVTHQVCWHRAREGAGPGLPQVLRPPTLGGSADGAGNVSATHGKDDHAVPASPTSLFSPRVVMQSPACIIKLLTLVFYAPIYELHPG